MNKNDLLFFDFQTSETSDSLGMRVYSQTLKKAVAITDQGQLSSMSVVVLSSEVTSGKSVLMSERSQCEYLQNNILQEQITSALRQAHRPVPRTVIEKAHDVITNSKYIESLRNLTLEEKNLLFFLHSPRRGGDVRVRIYHTELQRAVSFGQKNSVSSIGVGVLHHEIKNGRTERMEEHLIEEYTNNSFLMEQVFKCLKKQSSELSEISPPTLMEMHEFIVNTTTESLAEMEDEE